jgi:2-hydroxy-3-keto-5-methylthiopentenyl-1-phosphate phosphatase
LAGLVCKLNKPHRWRKNTYRYESQHPHAYRPLTSPSSSKMRLLSVLLSATLCAATGLPPAGPPHHPSIYLDFDGTIAVTEAWENLATTAYLTLAANSTVPSWSKFTDIYYAEYLAATADFPEPDSVEEELEFQALPALTKVETDSFLRTKASGLFDTVSEALLAKEAAGVELRGGFWDFVAAADRRGIRVSIISRNWSVRWIRMVLRATGGSLAEKIFIYCPEILPDGVIRTNSRDRPVDVFSGEDKRELMKIVKGSSKDVVFIGDSNSDLGPILQSPTTVGVVAGLDSGSAVTIRNEPGLELWRAADGWVKRTSVKRGAYVLEDFREMLVLMEWEGPEILEGVIANFKASVDDEAETSADEAEDDADDSADDADDDVEDDSEDYEDDVDDAEDDVEEKEEEEPGEEDAGEEEEKEEEDEPAPSPTSSLVPTPTSKPKRGKNRDGNKRKRKDW